MIPISPRMGRWLAPFAQLLAIAFLLIHLLFWIVPAWTDPAVRHLSGLAATFPITLTIETRLLGMTLSTLHLAILIYALFSIAGIFRIFATGDWQRPEISTRLYRFGLALVVFAATTPLLRTLLALIMTMKNPPGQRALTIGLSSNDLVIALIGVLMVMLSYALKEAIAIAEDNRQIV